MSLSDPLLLKLVEIVIWPLLLLAALLVLYRILARHNFRAARFLTTDQARIRPVLSQRSGEGKVAAAMADAATFTSLESGPPQDPVIHLKNAVRLSPVNHQDAMWQVSEHFRGEYVVIVDLAFLHEDGAVRLIDFCSGITLGANGTFFQISTNVILLTPSPDQTRYRKES